MSDYRYLEDEEIYDYYADIDLEDLIGSNWSIKTVANALGAAGVVEKDAPNYYGDMSGLVFMHGDPEEVYSTQELDFIDSIKENIMFPQFSKRMSGTEVECHTFSVKVSETGHDAITTCISFEKIINKAFDGFNFFCFSTEDAVHFGCRVFGSKNNLDCALSAAVTTEMQFEQIIEELSFLAEVDDFTNYYRQVFSIITSNIDEDDYEQNLLGHRTRRSKYMEAVELLANNVGLDARKELDLYWDIHIDEEKEISFLTLLGEVEESLDFIKSKKVNPYELLFEAEQTEKKVDDVEHRHQLIEEEIAESLDDESLDEEPMDDEELADLLNDPEKMIQLLKKKKGL